jgi:hypothetical protein
VAIIRIHPLQVKGQKTLEEAAPSGSKGGIDG